MPADLTSENNRRSSRSYYVFLEERVQGPFSITDLLRLRDEKRVKLDTPACVEGSQEWHIVDTFLTHKVHHRKTRRTKSYSWRSFQLRMLPMAVFSAMALGAAGIGSYLVIAERMAHFGYLIIGCAFVFAVIGYFVYPRSD